MVTDSSIVRCCYAHRSANLDFFSACVDFFQSIPPDSPAWAFNAENAENAELRREGTESSLPSVNLGVLCALCVELFGCIAALGPLREDSAARTRDGLRLKS